MIVNGKLCTLKKELPENFIRPNTVSKCTWKKVPTGEVNPHTDKSHIKRPDILPNILHAVGQTPLVKLNRIPQEAGIKCDMYAKCEFFNPGGSVKDRIGYRMVQDAESQGKLKPGCTIIEPSSGNTGIGIALACAVKGYKCIIVMPEKMSNEKVDTLRVLGAKVIRTPTEAGFESPEGLIAVSQCLQKQIKDSIVLDQYRNASNPLAHYDGTAEEILQQCGGDVDMIVCGAGTGGTVCGIGRKIKEKCEKCIIVGADPEGSILAEPESLNKSDVSFYEVEGIGYDFIPTVLDRSVVDVWKKCNDKIALKYARKLNSEEGILSGASSGTAIAVALEMAKDLKEGQKCVVILPDSIRNYMTKFVSDNWLEARGFKEPINEHEHWWWNRQVKDIQLNKKPLSVLPTITCKEAIDIMKNNKIDEIPIISNDGLFKGMLTLGHLTTKIVSLNLMLSEPVENAIFKQYRTINGTTILGLVSRILEKDTFVFIGETNTVLTRMDLLNFISTNELTSKLNDLKLIENGNGNSLAEVNGCTRHM